MYYGLNGNKTHFYREIDKELDIDSEGIIKRALIKLSHIKDIEAILEYLK
jgi:hypothetical protein